MNAHSIFSGFQSSARAFPGFRQSPGANEVKRLSACLLLASLLAISVPPVTAQVYQVGHCLFGCPQGADSTNHLLVRAIYALSYNTQTKSADWVAYEISAGSIGIASSLSREALADDYVQDTLQNSDFEAGVDSGLIRAQYVPLVGFAATPYWQEVNYLTNAVARSTSLSQGAWYGLDWAIRNLVNREESVYVVTGPVFYPDLEPRLLPVSTQHRVPDAFFKIVVTQEGRSAAFLFEQDTPVHLHHCEQQSSVEAIEGLTGLDLFPDLSRPLEPTLHTVLGCFQ
ncbi:MAG: DNA/RNA non-specific endonuclease [Proteobacteria bacterium]|nr:DNA/RNA non-specific endonuclease [Pseudomonadota bacterium]MDA0927506.1 DNA/RNA non-specific endonuclease [Pseudomonadota bacterium]